MSELWYGPNQQAVRADGSGPGVGEPPVAIPAAEPEPEAPPENPLDLMTKAQLLEHALGLGLPVTDAMTKSEIRAAIDEAAAG